MPHADEGASETTAFPFVEKRAKKTVLVRLSLWREESTYYASKASLDGVAMRMSRRYGLLFVLIIAFATSQAWAGEVAPKVTSWDQAFELASIAHGHLSKDFVDEAGKYRYFYEFTLLGRSYNVIGQMQVNTRTGDVWDTYGCRKYHGRRLTEAKQKIRATFTEEEMKHYQEMEDLRPVCIHDPVKK